jgi:ParB-like chromosome segregation protein Spo0J
MFSQAVAQRIEHKKLSELTPYPRNPRCRSDAQIAGSIAACAIKSSILVDADTVMTGGVRLRAARNSGMDTVPVFEVYLGKSSGITQNRP